MNSSEQLNFVADPEKFGVRFLPKDDSPIIAICGKNLKKRTTGSASEIKMHYNFSSFDFPNLASLFGKIVDINENSDASIVPDSTLIIVVDNSFDIDNPDGEDTTYKDAKVKNNPNLAFNPKKLNYAFIDHHLYETKQDECPYHSNSIMIYENFMLIAKILNKVINEKQIDDVGVLFHTDLDGIGSGLMIAKILQLIKENAVSEIDNNTIADVGLAMVLGEYGDISDKKEEDLQEIFNPSQLYASGLMKKFEILTKNLGRYMKAIRPVIDAKAHIRSDAHNAEIVEKYDELKIKYGIGYDEILYAYNKIKSFFNNLNSVTTLDILSLVSRIVQDPINRKIISMVQEEIDFMTDSYLRPETPQFDFCVKFKDLSDNEENWPTYRILFIDSAMDVGRSVMWTYRGRLQYFKDDLNAKKFSMANYKRAIIFMLKACKNICCYNLFSGKLSLQSDDASAFEIGKAFGGGGHGNIGNGSLGSVIVSFNDLKKHTIVTEMV